MGNKKNKCSRRSSKYLRRRLMEKNFHAKRSDTEYSKENSSNTLEGNSIGCPDVASDQYDSTTIEQCFTFEPTREMKQETNISGRRIVDILHLLNALKSIRHTGFDCSFYDLTLISENRCGIKSFFKFKCDVCSKEDIICSENDDIHINPSLAESSQSTINKLCVTAMIVTGGGYSQFKEICATLDVPFMSNRTYQKSHNEVSEVMRDVAWSEMKQAGEEEYRLAKEDGNVDTDGTPVISVIVDGAWSKRSYRTNYNALSGVACIIGSRTKKILYIGVKNKFCATCARRKNGNGKDIDVPHTCFKNWTGPSTGMESKIISEGFRLSMEMHKLKYGRVIGDGDSSVYRKIIDSMPYGPHLLVQKIGCKNHLMRLYINKLKEIAKNCNRDIREHINKNLLRFYGGVTKAIEFRRNQDVSRNEKIQQLGKDITNGPRHIFGDHAGCQERGYFCTKSNGDESNLVTKMPVNTFAKIMEVAQNLAKHASSLIEKETTNAAELYNSIIAKFVGGKRVNFSLKNSYGTRCNAAVISMNSKENFHEKIHKNLGISSVGRHTYKFSSRNRNNLQRRRLQGYKLKKRYTATTDMEYGPNAGSPIEDLPSDEYEKLKREFLNKLEDANLDEIQNETKGQYKEQRWQEERRKRITASHFGSICKKKKNTATAAKVLAITKSNFTGNESTKHGLKHEETAKAILSAKIEEEIDDCGLFVDQEFKFLGASPDGLIGVNRICEIKCPFNARHMKIREAIDKKLIKYLRIEDGKIYLKENSDYMFQIQGQLHITKRNMCYFVVWTEIDVFISEIIVDLDFWRNNMEQQLHTFYYNSLLPELIDSRHARNMPLRIRY